MAFLFPSRLVLSSLLLALVCPSTATKTEIDIEMKIGDYGMVNFYKWDADDSMQYLGCLSSAAEFLLGRISEASELSGCGSFSVKMCYDGKFSQYHPLLVSCTSAKTAAASAS